MTILNIAGYKFIALDNLADLQANLLAICRELNIKGTILLSAEGININLAGLPENIDSFIAYLRADARFLDIPFHRSNSSFQPFNFLKVKIKKEIITMKLSSINPALTPAPSISPQEFKQWLDEGRDITILDTRNDYEVRFGTFHNAINPNIENFTEFAETYKNLDPNKPVVMFCTGGIRCEKAAIQLQQEGFKEVYQLHRGILNYFKEVGNAHYDGECFVFDQRVSLDANLEVTHTQQCKICQGPIKQDTQHVCTGV